MCTSNTQTTGKTRQAGSRSGDYVVFYVCGTSIPGCMFYVRYQVPEYAFAPLSRRSPLRAACKLQRCRISFPTLVETYTCRRNNTFLSVVDTGHSAQSMQQTAVLLEQYRPKSSPRHPTVVVSTPILVGGTERTNQIVSRRQRPCATGSSQQAHIFLCNSKILLLLLFNQVRTYFYIRTGI